VGRDRPGGLTVRVVQLTDTHVKADPDDLAVMEWFGGITLHDPAESLAFVLADIAALDVRPDLVIGTGDLADRGHPAAYRRLNAMLNELAVPAMVVPGNHDLAEHLDEHLPGGVVELGTSTEADGWTFVFARTGNTEWGELGPAQVAALDDRLARRRHDNVFVWMHHPPVNLMGAFGNEVPFLAEDLGVLHERHTVAAVAAGHVHGPHDVTFGDIAVHASPSTFMGGGGPGYRIFDFSPTGYTTQVRSFPERSTMTDAKRDTLVANMRARHAAQAAEPVARDLEHHAHAHVREWLDEAEARRGRPAAG
jgi:3',5'-cyclic-AMP phosphodiesterase